MIVINDEEVVCQLFDGCNNIRLILVYKKERGCCNSPPSIMGESQSPSNQFVISSQLVLRTFLFFSVKIIAKNK